MSAEQTPEGAVLNSCMELLDIMQIYHWRNNTGAVKTDKKFFRYGKVGSSDILGILPDGRLLAVECKRPEGGVVSDAQKDFLVNIERNRGIAVIARSVDDLMKALKEAGAVKK